MDRRTAKARRDRKIRKESELQRENQSYTQEIIEDNGKETED